MTQQVLSPAAKYGYIPGLDGLRAISVIIVLIAHFGLSHIVPGGFGVTVFFFISGFLITRLLIAETEIQGKIKLKQFYIRRMIRLYPALLFMVLVSSALFGSFGFGEPTWHELVAALGYGMNVLLTLQSAGIGETYMSWNPLWSLAVEEHFYLFFPLLLAAFGKKWKQALLAVTALVLFAPLWRAWIVFGTQLDADTYTYMMSDTRMDSILWGCLASLLLHAKPQILQSKWIVGWAPTLLAGAAILLTLGIRNPEFRNIARYSVQGAALLILICNLYFNSGLRFAVTWLEFTPLAWLGRMSYPLYLWHFVMLDFWSRTVSSTSATIAFAVLGSLLAAIISVYLVERPTIWLRKRYGAHIEPPITEGPVRSAKPQISDPS